MKNQNDLLEICKDNIAILTLNRPEQRNSLSINLLNLLNETISRLGKATPAPKIEIVNQMQSAM